MATAREPIDFYFDFLSLYGYFASLRIEAVAARHGRTVRWNSMLLGPDSLHVVNHHDHALLPVDIELWPDLYPKELVCWPPYFDLRLRQRAGVSVAVSSGIVDDVTDWTLLPNRSVLRLPFDGAEMRMTVLDERSSGRSAGSTAASTRAG